MILYEIFVSRSFRGQQIESRILIHVVNLAKSLRYKRIILKPHPFENNFPKERLVRWYKRYGFTERPDFPNELERYLT